MQIVRPMRQADLPAVFAVQCLAYPAIYHESLDALSSRLAHGADFCFVAEQAGRVVAYIFAYPWQGQPPALHESLVPAREVQADHLFMHDLAVSPASRGAALGARLYAAVIGRAMQQGLCNLRLVAVGQACAFWEKLGFAPKCDGNLHDSYGQAMLMHKVLQVFPSV